MKEEGRKDEGRGTRDEKDRGRIVGNRLACSTMFEHD